MTYIYSSFYCAVCSSDTAGKKLDFKTSEGTGATGVNLGKHWKTIDSFCFPPSPKTIELFEKALPFPENHWSVWKTSPRPLPLWPGRGQGRGPLHSMSPSVLSNFDQSLLHKKTWLIFMGMKKKNGFLWGKNHNGWLKEKLSFSKTQTLNIFWEISGIGSVVQ